jgi:LuxR family maltose regulon positive regulatory protein
VPESLLQTKLYTPPLRPNLVSRPRLIERLNQGLAEDKKLTLISAPAGFGKTTLITEWRYRIPDSTGSKSACQDPKFGWLSLDEGENDPVQFLSYFLSALQRIIPGIGETALASLGSPQPPPTAAVLTPVLNEFATLAEAGALDNCCYMLVIDDYHVIQAQATHDILQFFVDHLPPPLHLAICSRADLPWSLARLRANDQIMELRSADLRFTLEETTEFLNRMMGLGLSAADLAALENRTEGWIAGLQLAALSLQGLDETHLSPPSPAAAATSSTTYSTRCLPADPRALKSFCCRLQFSTACVAHSATLFWDMEKNHPSPDRRQSLSNWSRPIYSSFLWMISGFGSVIIISLATYYAFG